MFYVQPVYLTATGLFPNCVAVYQRQKVGNIHRHELLTFKTQGETYGLRSPFHSAKDLRVLSSMQVPYRREEVLPTKIPTL